MLSLRKMLHRHCSMKFIGLSILLTLSATALAETRRGLVLMQGLGAAGDFAFRVVSGGGLSQCDLVADGGLITGLQFIDEAGCINLQPDTGNGTLYAGQYYHISNAAVLANYLSILCTPPTNDDAVTLTLYCSNGGGVYPTISGTWNANCNLTSCTTTTAPLTVTL